MCVFFSPVEREVNTCDRTIRRSTIQQRSSFALRLSLKLTEGVYVMRRRLTILTNFPNSTTNRVWVDMRIGDSRMWGCGSGRGMANQ